MSRQVDFNTNSNESYLIREIVKRAVKLAGGARKLEERYGLNILDLTMDLTATHCNGNPLRLEELLRADDFNFAHDVFQIGRFIDRTTGKLTREFSPRFTSATPRAKVRMSKGGR